MITLASYYQYCKVVLINQYTHMRIFGYITACLFTFTLFNCVPDETDPVTLPPERQTVFGAFEASENSNNIVLEGIITESTADNLSNLLSEYPNTQTILMSDVDGATNAEAAFAAARVVRNNEINVHILDNSTIVREAIDFMLGGTIRTKGEDTRLGVGAWINEQGMQATDFPFGDEAHLPWINFYQEMGFQFQQATDFYNFSIFAADSEDVFFLNNDQINTFGLLN